MSDVADPPTTAEEFNNLRDKSREELFDMGLSLWSEDTGLMLLPRQWYDDLPEGVEVTAIDGETKRFSRSNCSADHRFGALAYGVIPDE